jgi:hypothetical protein
MLIQNKEISFISLYGTGTRLKEALIVNPDPVRCRSIDLRFGRKCQKPYSFKINMRVKSSGAVVFVKGPVCCHTHEGNIVNVSYTLILFLKSTNTPKCGNSSDNSTYTIMCDPYVI